MRRYPAVTLARVKMDGATYEEVEATMFQKLFGYLSMGNDIGYFNVMFFNNSFKLLSKYKFNKRNIYFLL